MDVLIKCKWFSVLIDWLARWESSYIGRFSEGEADTRPF